MEPQPARKRGSFMRWISRSSPGLGLRASDKVTCTCIETEHTEYPASCILPVWERSWIGGMGGLHGRRILRQALLCQASAEHTRGAKRGGVLFACPQLNTSCSVPGGQIVYMYTCDASAVLRIPDIAPLGRCRAVPDRLRLLIGPGLTVHKEGAARTDKLAANHGGSTTREIFH